MLYFHYMEEIWKSISEYEGMYDVSNLGRIRSHKYINSPRTMANKKDPNGYESIILCKYGTRNQQRIHRLVAIAFLTNPNNYPVVNHKNGIRNDNRAENLEWCTQSQNLIHSRDVLGYRVKEGSRQGGKNGRAKISEEIVLSMRKDRELGKSNIEISRKYNIPSSTVGNILSRHTWKHI